jgi:uncharacterized OB-fold protein
VTAVLPAVEAWLWVDEDDLVLLGSRCGTCGTYVFPPTGAGCPNPSCDGTELEKVPLSRTGRLWSWTVNHYAPPAPYVSEEPFVPYAVAAVELTEERLVILGQLAPDVEVLALEIGQEMELAAGALREADGSRAAVWNWRPARQAA